ncbi:MAG: hypothetical protein GXO83_08085 [Chlorobi bacterium]|nr:hypothetical protein [Chlorobiota bacterium]
MKTINRLFLLIPALILITSCEDKVQVRQTFNVPVYLTYDELRVPVSSSQSVPLQKPGKIYIKDQFIFINEYLQGIHVIDNSDPAHPVNLTYLDIPGNVDMSVRDNILYADSYVDLVALDITDPANIRETGRAKNIFPYILPTPDNDYAIDYPEVDESKGLVLEWKLVTKTRDVDLEPYKPPYPYPYPFYKNEAYLMFESSGLSSGSNPGSHTGTGGSMARFTIYKNWLYALTDSDLRIINISDPQNMIKENAIHPGNDQETIFPYGDMIFLGSQTGMTIYRLTDPLNPQYVSSYSHIRSCDPVVVRNGYAYVTLRAGNHCGQGENRLRVIDVSFPVLPVERGSYPLEYPPYGLAIHDSVLYVCEGGAGLKVYDASDPLHLVYKQTFGEFRAWDVIAYDDLLMMIGDDGLYQYRVESFDKIKQISSLPVAMTGR